MEKPGDGPAGQAIMTPMPCPAYLVHGGRPEEPELEPWVQTFRLTHTMQRPGDTPDLAFYQPGSMNFIGAREWAEMRHGGPWYVLIDPTPEELKKAEGWAAKAVGLATAEEEARGVSDGLLKSALELADEVFQAEADGGAFPIVAGDFHTIEREDLTGQRADLSGMADASGVIQWIELSTGLVRPLAQFARIAHDEIHRLRAELAARS